MINWIGNGVGDVYVAYPHHPHYNGQQKVAQIKEEYKKIGSIPTHTNMENTYFYIGDIDVDVDEDTFTVHITVPPVTLTDVNVDISSLDFIFYNEKANTSTVTEEAFKACEDDVEKESQEQEAIYELAEQNAKNVLTALVRPIIDQSETEYSLVVE